MPGGDRTGPLGMGAVNGRGAGYCRGFNTPGYMNPGPSRAMRGYSGPNRGMGGHGWRNWFRATGQPGWFRGGLGSFAAQPAPVNADVEKQVLEQEIQQLQAEMDRINQRLADLSSANAET